MKRLAQSSAAHMAGAFLAMGAWAMAANWAHPWPASPIAGLVQGSLSAAITLGMKRGLEALSARLSGLTALVLPPLAAGVASLTLLSIIHAATGTPEILRTIAVPSSVATLYAAGYSLTLWRLKEAGDGQ
ncbi:MAG: hypothetical protein AAF968_27260 [Pseudomonadota bacterium]